MQMAGYESFFL